jgi:hypothetical protein
MNHLRVVFVFGEQMNEETTTQQVEEVTGESEATAAAAAFASARSDEPIETPQPEIEEVTEVAEEPQPEPKRFAGRTEDEIEQMLGEIPVIKESYRKQIDNLAGNYGALKSAFQKLQQETPKGEAVTVTDEDVADMAGDFPELAGMTKNALNNVLKRVNLRGGAAFDPTVIDSKVNSLVTERVAQERVSMHVELLDGLTPGWKEIVGVRNPQTGEIPETEYRKWLATQSADYQQRIMASNNAFEIGGSVKEFNSYRETTLQKQQANKQRLTNAVRPTGSQAVRSAISEQQAADLAFKRERGR